MHLGATTAQFYGCPCTKTIHGQHLGDFPAPRVRKADLHQNSNSVRSSSVCILPSSSSVPPHRPVRSIASAAAAAAAAAQMSGPGGYPSAHQQPWQQHPSPYTQQQQPPPATHPTGPYGSAPPTGSFYGQSQPPQQWGAAPQHQHQHPGGYPPQQAQQYGQFAPSRVQFPPDTDPEIVRLFQMADQDGSGLIDDKELQRVLSLGQPFSIRTVRLMLHLFTPQTSFKIGPIEFVALWKTLKQWRGVFGKFDKDFSGKIDSEELREALLSLGYAISPAILKVLLSKYDSTGQGRAIEYDKFVECGLIVKGLTDKFKEKDSNFTGSATLNYEAFMLMVLPYIMS